MDLRNYRVEPDKGLFEKIERRVARRRWMRMGGGAAVVCVVVAVVALMVWPKGEVVQEGLVAQADVQPAAVAVESADVAVVPEEATTVAQVPAVKTERVGEREVAEAAPTAVVAERNSETVAAVVEAKPALEPAVKPASVKPVPVAEKKEMVAEQPVENQEGATVDLETESTVVKGNDPSQLPVHIDNLVWAPNVIMPNGDVDDNRRFKLKFSSSVTEFRILIYNRGGRQVFVSEDPNFEWDGTFNGTVMPQGAYVWVAKFRDTDNHPHQEKGTVTIVR